MNLPSGSHTLRSCPPPASTLDAARLRVFREVVRARLPVRRGRGAELHPARGLPADRRARARGGRAAARAHPARDPPHRARPRAARPRRGDPRPHVRPPARRSSPSRSLTGGRLRIGSFQTANATIVPRAIAAFAAAPTRRRALARRGDHAAPRSRACAPATVDVAVVTHLPELDERRRRGRRPRRRRAVRRPARAPPARPQARGCACATCATRPGSRPSRASAQPHAARRRARAQGFEPRVRFGAEQWLSKQGLVAAGVGVTLIPGLAIATVRDDIVLRSLGPHAPAAPHRRRCCRPATAPRRSSRSSTSARGGGRAHRGAYAERAPALLAGDDGRGAGVSPLRIDPIAEARRHWTERWGDGAGPADGGGHVDHARPAGPARAAERPARARSG